MKTINLLMLGGFTGCIIMIILISNVEAIYLSTMHLGKEVQLCEKYVNHGWDRSPYYYLDCSYPKSETRCMIHYNESSIISQRLRSIEKTDLGYKIITVEGIHFDVLEEVTLDDTIIMKKTWKTFNETTTEITNDQQMYEWNDLFHNANANIKLEAYYYYQTNYHDEYDGKSYAENYSSGEQTPNYNPNFCNDIRNKSIHYEVLEIISSQKQDSVK